MTTWSSSFDMSTFVTLCYTRGAWQIKRTSYRDKSERQSRVQFPSTWVIL